MKKNSKKTKRILSLAMIGAIGTSFAFTSPSSASVAQISSVQNITQQQNAYIENWDEQFQNMYQLLKAKYPLNYYAEKAKLELTNVYQSSVEADGSPIITNSNNLFVGRTTLTNNTNQDQTLTTNEFSKTFENSVTNSTTNGFNLGASASATFKIPLVGETSIELSTEYNFSDTKETTKSESYTYTASSQNIVVPANSSVEVIVNLNTAKISGNVNLLSHVDGKVNYSSYVGDGNVNGHIQTFRQFLYYEVNPRLGLSNFNNVKLDQNNRVFLVGKGKYSAEYGTEFAVTVRPVEKPKGFAATPSKLNNEGYTYTVKPEVKKTK
ncbi:ETX/MTX2 family pore-forming toxin [Bacillus toyonensis]|uniref:ETX/MTX2 family pore-forming toxin n=1 Tax=Bacillus toyonensis TaxID=155322 RepID=UPI002E2249D3|nr:ETX/MTX2 family pore-forming toxin [Bacillus toyonensis]